MEIRLNKYISEGGKWSRREADKLIEEGRVTVNGRQAKIGTVITHKDKVWVDGHLVEPMEEPIYIAFNKPIGVTCTTDRSEPDNILDYVNFKSRIFNIGRLDKDSEGLIFLTNDGDIVNKILRADNEHEKEYMVTVNKTITADFLEGMSAGVPILGVNTRRCTLYQEATNRFRIILKQGLNRQIRRMCEHFGYEVTRLIRIRIMQVTLKGIPVGDWRFLEPEEVAQIKALTAVSANNRKPAASKVKTGSVASRSASKGSGSASKSRAKDGIATEKTGRADGIERTERGERKSNNSIGSTAKLTSSRPTDKWVKASDHKAEKPKYEDFISKGRRDRVKPERKFTAEKEGAGERFGKKTRLESGDNSTSRTKRTATGKPFAAKSTPSKSPSKAKSATKEEGATAVKNKFSTPKGRGLRTGKSAPKVEREHFSPSAYRKSKQKD